MPPRRLRSRFEPVSLMTAALVVVGSAYAAPRELAESANLEYPGGSAPAAVFDASVANDALPPLSITKLVGDGYHFRLDTPHGPVHVWVPHRYEPSTAATVLYVHGYHTDLDGAWTDHQLPQQFALAGINAMFIAPEAPANKHEKVSWTSLQALLDTVQKSISVPMPRGRVIALGHSGAFRTLEMWVESVSKLDTVVLVDAAYGDVWAYRRWLVASTAHHLINIGDDTVRRADLLHKYLPSTVVLDGLDLVTGIPEADQSSRILYVRSAIGHMPLVTGGIVLPQLLRSLGVERVLTAPIPYPL